jgi:uncharacterized ubiquitin-like protein YukD
MSDIEVIFQQKGEKNISIKIKSNNKFSELINKYYKTKCISKRDRNKIKFMFMNNEIMPSSETTLKDFGIKNSSNIQVELAEKIGESYSELQEKKNRMINKEKALYNFIPKDYKSKSEKIKKDISKKYIIDTKKEHTPINTIEMIEDINTFSTIIKEEIIKKKKENPESIVPISEAVNSDEQSSLFALGILGAFLQNKGTEVMIEKENSSTNNPEKEQYLQTCMMFATSEVGLSKKYEIQFDVDEAKSKLLLENEEEAEKYLNSWRKIISKEMSVPEDTIFFFNPRKGSYIVDVKFIQPIAEDMYAELENFKKTHTEIRNVREKVIIEGCLLSPDLLDARFNKELGTWNRSNTKRGNELYDPPHGWLGFGLNVLNKYNDTTWIGKQNIEGEWIVVYHGIARDQTKVVKLVLEAENPNDSHLKPGKAQFHEDAIDNRHYKEEGKTKCNKCDRIFSCEHCGYKFSFDKCSNEEKSCNCSTPKKFRCNQCLHGVYCTPRIQDFLVYAKNFEFIDKNNVKQMYRIGFMCRADPKKIRESASYSSYYICSGELDEIRPYRILIKENAIEIIENWTGKKIVSRIFDSDVDNWDSGRDFSNYIIGKSNLLFMIIDDQNNRFGGYISSQITGADTYITDSQAFIFSLNSNGRLSAPTKFDINSPGSAFISMTTHDRYIFAFGGGYDLKMDKKSTKYMGNSNPCSYNFGQYTNALYGKTYPDRFTPKRWLVYQMK